MVALPSISAYTGSTVTEAGFKQALSDLRTYLADLFDTTGTIPGAVRKLGVPFNNHTTRSTTGSITAADNGTVIQLTTTGLTVTLPSAAALDNTYMIVIRNAAGGNTIDCAGSDTVDGAATYTLRPHQIAIVHRINSTSFAIYGLGSGDGSSTWFTGSNGNGKWVRNLEGYQTCIREDIAVDQVATAQGGGYRSNTDATWTFPISFIAGSSPVCFGNAFANWWPSFGPATNTDVAVRLYGFNTSAGVLNARVAAVGRWK